MSHVVRASLLIELIFLEELSSLQERVVRASLLTELVFLEELSLPSDVFLSTELSLSLLFLSMSFFWLLLSSAPSLALVSLLDKVVTVMRRGLVPDDAFILGLGLMLLICKTIKQKNWLCFITQLNYL